MSPATAVNSTRTRSETSPAPPAGREVAGRNSEVPAAGWPVDSVDFSGLTVSEAISRLEQPRLDAIRRQIAEGTYLSEEKLNVVYDRLAEILRRLKDETTRASA